MSFVVNPYRFGGGAPAADFGNNSRDFDGTEDWIHIGDVFNFDSTGDDEVFTLAAWVKISETAFQHILGRFGAAVTDRAWMFYATTAGKLRFFWSQGTGDPVATRIYETTSAVIDSTAWVHVAMEYDGTTATLSDRVTMYINGGTGLTVGSGLTAILENGDPQYIQTVTAPLNIGGSTNDAAGTSATRFTDGKLADVRIYDALIGSTEVANLAAGTDYQTNLVGWWLLNTDDVDDYAGVNDGTNEPSAGTPSVFDADGPLD